MRYTALPTTFNYQQSNSVDKTWTFVAEHLRDGLKFQNAILQDGSSRVGYETKNFLAPFLKVIYGDNK